MDLRLTSTATMKAPLLVWYPLVNAILTVLILTEREWSVCGFMVTEISPKAAKSREALAGRFHGSSLEIAASQRVKGTDIKFGTVTSSTREVMSFNKRREVSIDFLQINSINPSKEVESLLAFKSGITSDPFGVLESWRENDSHPCSWEGVACSNNSNQVSALNLSGLHLVGTISNLLGELLLLEKLDLSQNFLDGSVPASLANCSNLLYLNISFNKMAGDIPPLLGRLASLQTLDLSNNNLTGEIPETLGNCSSLRHLDLGTNSFRGSIPLQFGALYNLQILSLENCSISGSIPSSIGNCSSLSYLWLGYNSGLGGELPDELGKLSNTLQDFRINTCSFRGSFSMWLLNCTAMQYLQLAQNSFTGGIPGNVEQLSNLDFFNVEGNSFSGDIPTSIVNITSLQRLSFEGNLFTGTIPQDIGLLGRLKGLDFSTNLFSESVMPKSILNLTSLQILYLEQSQLIGTIPPDIGMLGSLIKLYLFGNGLTGLIPSSLSNCSLLQHLMLGYNSFAPQDFPPWIVSLRNLTDTYIASTNIQGEIPEEIGQLAQLVYFEAWSNKLAGRIPPSVGNCTLLINFDVRNNSLTGKIPLELGNLPVIEDFMIGSNFFDPGPFPAFIYNFTMLEFLEINDNSFNGRLDGDFGKLQQLQGIYAEDNKFEGPFPESINNCSQLIILELAGNFLSGEISPGLSNLSNLNSLMLGSNNFHGNIPGDLMRSFRLLQALDLSDNYLEGTLPTDFGNLVNLQTVDISVNLFEEILPLSLGNCTQLLSLDFSNNKLSGSIPGDAFASLSSLNTMNLAQNLFSGLWPSEFDQLKRIVVINISGNSITGSIPLGLGGCSLLNVLDLSFNNFTGPIPEDIGLLNNLTNFNASYNNFDGPIPDVGTFRTNVTANSFLGNPALCGKILGPQRQCPTAAEPSPSQRSHCRGFKCNYIWIPLVSILGTIAVVGVSIVIFCCSRAKIDTVHNKLIMYTVNPGLIFSESDIFALMDSGQRDVIGVGAKSIVYRAVSPNGETVAVKVFSDAKATGPLAEEDKERWEKELESEARTLGQLRHRNIIKIFSLCYSMDVKAIILEYMAKGSLHAHLHTNGPCELTWEQRFQLLLGITHGMVYIHHEFPNPIIHRDLKPSNILLGDEMEPKVCDFGISKFVTNFDGEATASNFCGTFGYMAPEYGVETRLSTKGDVYSYGVVLLELLTAREPTQSNRTSVGEDDGLVGLVNQSFQEAAIQTFDLLDQSLKIEGASNEHQREQMMLTMRVGHLCTSKLPHNRPSMRVVLEMLLEIQNLGQGTVPFRTIDDLVQDEVGPPQSNDDEE